MTVALDIGIVAILLIVILVGALRGFLKASFGIFHFALFLVLCIFVLPIVLSALLNVGAVSNFASSIGGKIGGSKEYMTVAIAAGDDVKAVLAEHNAPSFLRSIFASLVRSALADGAESVTLGYALGALVVKILIGIVGVILFAFVSWLIMLLIRRLVRLLHRYRAFRVIDRIFGALFCLAFTAAVFLFAIGQLHTVRERIPSVDRAIAKTTIVRAAYEHNPLQKAVDLVGIDRLLKSFGK